MRDALLLIVFLVFLGIVFGVFFGIPIYLIGSVIFG